MSTYEPLGGCAHMESTSSTCGWEQSSRISKKSQRVAFFTEPITNMLARELRVTDSLSKAVTSNC